MPAPNRTTSSKYQVYPQPQIIEMDQTRTVLVYDSNYSFLADALVVMLLAVVTVVPVFNGFWLLERNTSLSPLELAKAFGSPILDRANSNMSSEEIVKSVGSTSVRYGLVSALNHRRLQFDKAEAVARPSAGHVYE